MPIPRLASLLLPLLAACSSTREAGPTFDVSSEETAQAPRNDVSAEPVSDAFDGEVDIAVFITVEGELWTERMRRNVLARFPEALAAHDQVRLYPDERLQTLGRLRNERDELSDEWLTHVRRRLGWNPPEVILEVTVRADRGSALSPSTGQAKAYPEIGFHTRAVRFDGERRGEISTRSHTLLYGRVVEWAAEDIHELVLGELMP